MYGKIQVVVEGLPQPLLEAVRKFHPPLQKLQN